MYVEITLFLLGVLFAIGMVLAVYDDAPQQVDTLDISGHDGEPSLRRRYSSLEQFITDSEVK